MKSTVPRRIQIEPANAYSHEAHYGRDKYTAQNILYLQVNMPACAYDTDTLDSVWSDREYTKWTKTCAHLPRDRPFIAADDASFLKFAGVLVGHPVDGARAVHYSNQGGFEIFRIDTWKRGADSPQEPTFSGMSEPNVIWPRPRRCPFSVDIYGRRSYPGEEYS